MAHPAGETESDAARLNFDRRLKLEFKVPVSRPMLGCLPIASLMMRSA